MAESNVLFHQLRRLSRLLRRQPRGAHPVGHLARQILAVLEKEGSLSTRELAGRLDIRISSLNELLPRLEKEGLLERRRSAEDHRVFEVSLSASGRRLLEESEAADRELSGLLSGILSPEEAETLSSLLRKLTDGLEAGLPEPCPASPTHGKEEFHAKKHGPRRPRLSD